MRARTSNLQSRFKSRLLHWLCSRLNHFNSRPLSYKSSSSVCIFCCWVINHRILFLKQLSYGFCGSGIQTEPSSDDFSVLWYLGLLLEDSKAWLELEDPLPRWSSHMAGSSSPGHHHRATWVSTWHGSASDSRSHVGSDDVFYDVISEVTDSYFWSVLLVTYVSSDLVYEGDYTRVCILGGEDHWEAGYHN